MCGLIESAPTCFFDLDLILEQFGLENASQIMGYFNFLESKELGI
jgi:hypothetical protein